MRRHGTRLAVATIGYFDGAIGAHTAGGSGAMEAEAEIAVAIVTGAGAGVDRVIWRCLLDRMIVRSSLAWASSARHCWTNFLD
jgi:hypothetical protein